MCYVVVVTVVFLSLSATLCTWFWAVFDVMRIESFLRKDLNSILFFSWYRRNALLLRRQRQSTMADASHFSGYGGMPAVHPSVPTPPGLESIYSTLRKIYPDQRNPLQVTALLKFWWVDVWLPKTKFFIVHINVLGGQTAAVLSTTIATAHVYTLNDLRSSVYNYYSCDENHNTRLGTVLQTDFTSA